MQWLCVEYALNKTKQVAYTIQRVRVDYASPPLPERARTHTHTHKTTTEVAQTKRGFVWTMLKFKKKQK